MTKLTIQTLGPKVAEKRGTRGVRETAKEIGINHSTLLRIENGLLPDLETFGKVCKWLELDPATFLGIKPIVSAKPDATIHFRKEQAIRPETAKALADLIVTAHRAMMAMEK